jgi:DnaK suppressor protein
VDKLNERFFHNPVSLTSKAGTIPMERREQLSYHETLSKLAKRLIRQVDASEESLREDIVAPGTNSHLPTHPADAGVEGMDVEIAVAQNEEGLLEQVDAALDRIDRGTFGTCQQCGREIETERLQAIPYAANCVQCASRQKAPRGN